MVKAGTQWFSDIYLKYRIFPHAINLICLNIVNCKKNK